MADGQRQAQVISKTLEGALVDIPVDLLVAVKHAPGDVRRDEPEFVLRSQAGASQEHTD